MNRLEMDGFWIHVRGWRDGPLLILSMPRGVGGYAIASLRLEKIGGMTDGDVVMNNKFAAVYNGHKPAFDPEFEPAGNA
jgi:hypothetical protein